MRVHLALLAALGAVLAVTAQTADARLTAPFCTGAHLAGSFTAVYGSAGAGNISYRLTLRNVGPARCSVTGLPRVQLIGKQGKKLPTHVQPAFPGALSAALLPLARGKSAFATARFSPDVPGTGEQTIGRCELTAYTLRVTAPGGGTTTVKVAPPTPVCEHGRLLFSAYGM